MPPESEVNESNGDLTTVEAKWGRTAHILLRHGTRREVHTTPSKVCLHDSRVYYRNRVRRGFLWYGLVWSGDFNNWSFNGRTGNLSFEGFEQLRETSPLGEPKR